LEDIEIVCAKIVPEMCQDCAKLPLSGITKSTTINGEVYDSITSKNCNECPREQSECQRPNGFRSFPAHVSRIADARCLAFAISEARGIAKDLSTCEKQSRALAYICIVPKYRGEAMLMPMGCVG
jgi:hypothetical protein